VAALVASRTGLEDKAEERAFSVLYSHAIRYEWLTFNPISKVRTSSKRLREKDVLSPAEFQALLGQLSVRDRAMVRWQGVPACGGSEMIALTWTDVNTLTLEVNVLRSVSATASAIRRPNVPGVRFRSIRWCSAHF